MEINLLLQGLFLSPLLYIFISSTKSLKDISWYILKNNMSEYILNTLLLVIIAMIVSLIIGTFLAYYEVMYKLKLSKLFKQINILAFCIPSYILGYIYYDFFSSFLYYHFNISYDITNIYVVGILLGISFYPYVYIFARSYLKKIPASIILSSYILGKSRLETFFKIVLPLLKKSLILAILLVFIETINSYGLVSFFGIQVFSTGIYKLYKTSYDLTGAYFISSILVLFLIILIRYIFKILKQDRKYVLEYSKIEYEVKKISKLEEILVSIITLIIFLISFLFPLIYLLRWAFYTYKLVDYEVLFKLSKNTFLISVVASFCIIIFTIFVLEINRLNEKKYFTLFYISYAIPGIIVSISILNLFISLDNLISTKYLYITNLGASLILAYIFRFSVISYSNISSNISKIGKNYYYSSLLLAKSKLKTVFLIDIPMLLPSIISSFILLFIEIAKELPIAAINGRIETLAIRIDKYSADENISYVAIPSLIIILFCFVFTIIKNYLEEKNVL
ncbi:ABC transporter permease [Oceanivirga miroungae]|uniref:Iron(III) ABC transporter, permease protein n=1 Tax=Oceanivirga miroungae TaxID=1130046 RepID=A0A6I8ME96_9FUSO|nr:ABC transporter permease subunit [Oceanivirga miroungae]VWL85901.1 iron(III) ABC transporter, permease protein [Oceanivirga miroungae]